MSNKKAQITYTMIIYGGVIKSGTSVLKVTLTDPLDELKNFSLYYGDDITCKYTKCKKSVSELQKLLFAELQTNKINDLLYKLSVTDIMKIVKKECDVSKCLTLKLSSKEDKNLNNSDNEQDVEIVDNVKQALKTKKTKATPKKDRVVKTKSNIKIDDDDSEDEDCNQLNKNIKLNISDDDNSDNELPIKNMNTKIEISDSESESDKEPIKSKDKKMPESDSESDREPIKSKGKKISSNTKAVKIKKSEPVSESKNKKKTSKKTEIVLSDSDDDNDNEK